MISVQRIPKESAVKFGVTEIILVKYMSKFKTYTSNSDIYLISILFLISCGKVGPPKGFHNVIDYTKPYPDCCVNLVED